jgi:hypothetical protein
MNISVDFDDTYTRDPIFWDRFIYTAWEFGHDVYCVTAREPNKVNQEEVYDSIGKLIGKDNCYFTNSQAKAKYMSDQGIRIENNRLFADFKNTDFPY